MISIRNFLVHGLIIFCLTKTSDAQSLLNAGNQHGIQNAQELSTKEQAIVTISAFTAQGDTQKLQAALNNGLNAGLSINAIKEVLVQLYAYTGFPRSLNALNTFMIVIKDRKRKGLNDQLGQEPSPLPTNKSRLQFGTEMQTKLVGRPVKGEVFDFAPAIDLFLKDHLFGAIFGRDNLDWKTRELATIAALAALGGVDNQLRSHFGVGMYNGLTAGQLKHLVSIIQANLGSKEGNAANEVLQTVLNQNQDIRTQRPALRNADQNSSTLFPKGEKITNNNFTGNAWLQQMIPPDSSNWTQVGNVTFEPGARTNWHFHPGGQILLITSGTGYYQEKGNAKRIIKKGDLVNCPANIPHWHGASKDDELIQIAITNTQKGAVVWLQPVSDEEYYGLIERQK